GKPAESATPSSVPPAPAGAPSAKIVQADEHRIELPSATFRYTPGLGGKSVLLLCGDQLAVLAADGFTIRQVLALPNPYVAIAEREHYYVAIAGSPASVDI